MGGGAASEDGIGPYRAGCRAFTAGLRRVNWPTKFRPDLPEKYNGTIDSEEFLQIYTTSIQAVGEALRSWPTTSTSPSEASPGPG
jgi:hypothetical protein